MKEILDELISSLDDYVLSKFEKKVLSARLNSQHFGKAELLKLRTELFTLAKEKSTDSKQKQLIKWLEDANNLLLPDSIDTSYCRTYFSPGHDCLNAIIQQLNTCLTEVDICVFTISDNRIRDAITDAINRGINVRIITDDDKVNDRGSDIMFLSEKGAKVKIDHSRHHMHHKFALFDNEVLLSGSYNWTRSATEFNQENIIITNNIHAVSNYKNEFERLWQIMFELQGVGS